MNVKNVKFVDIRLKIEIFAEKRLKFLNVKKFA